jgi:hypothetical protein
MKPINIVTGNHGESPVHVEDIITYLASALQSGGFMLKHTLLLSASTTLRLIRYYYVLVQELDFILVVTEYITGNTFNDSALMPVIPKGCRQVSSYLMFI